MEHYIVISAIIGVFIVVIAIFGLVIFATTVSRRKYRSIKNRTEAVGTITRIQHISPVKIEQNLNEHYIVDYTFTDINGFSHNGNFEIGRLKNLKEGDKISVYYDTNKPDKCVTDYKLNAEKNLWWQALLVTLAIFSLPFIIIFISKN